MHIGFNTNIPYRGIIFHVQTEDSGRSNPVIITLLYHKGTILARKKTEYKDILEAPGWDKKVEELMKEQHKTMMKELIRGMHTEPVEHLMKEAEAGRAEAEAPQAIPVEAAIEISGDFAEVEEVKNAVFTASALGLEPVKIKAEPPKPEPVKTSPQRTAGVPSIPKAAISKPNINVSRSIPAPVSAAVKSAVPKSLLKPAPDAKKEGDKRAAKENLDDILLDFISKKKKE